MSTITTTEYLKIERHLIGSGYERDLDDIENGLVSFFGTAGADLARVTITDDGAIRLDIMSEDAEILRSEDTTENHMSWVAWTVAGIGYMAAA